MPLESGLRDRIISACKEEQFETAADLLVGDSKNSVTYEEVVSSFKKIGPTATGSLLNSINNIYQRNSGNLAMLKAKLHNVSSSHSMVSSDQQTTEMDPSEIDKDKLGHRISALRIKQKQMIAKNGHPDAKVAQQLSSIIAKKQNLEVHDYGDSFQKKNSQVSDFPVPGAKLLNIRFCRATARIRSLKFWCLCLRGWFYSIPFYPCRAYCFTHKIFGALPCLVNPLVWIDIL